MESLKFQKRLTSQPGEELHWTFRTSENIRPNVEALTVQNKRKYERNRFALGMGGEAPQCWLQFCWGVKTLVL